MEPDMTLISKAMLSLGCLKDQLLIVPISSGDFPEPHETFICQLSMPSAPQPFSSLSQVGAYIEGGSRPLSLWSQDWSLKSNTAAAEHNGP